MKTTSRGLKATESMLIENIHQHTEQPPHQQSTFEIVDWLLIIRNSSVEIEKSTNKDDQNEDTGPAQAVSFMNLVWYTFECDENIIEKGTILFKFRFANAFDILCMLIGTIAGK